MTMSEKLVVLSSCICMMWDEAEEMGVERPDIPPKSWDIAGLQERPKEMNTLLRHVEIPLPPMVRHSVTVGLSWTYFWSITGMDYCVYRAIERGLEVET